MVVFSNGLKYYTTREISKILNVSMTKVYELFRTKQLVNENTFSSRKLVSEQTLINKCFVKGDKMVTPVAN